MNLKGKILFFLCFMICLMIITGGCKKSSEIQADPTGALLKYFGCKQFQDDTNLNHVSTASTNDCIEFQYNGESILTLRHINGGFNCCPGEISADIEFNGNLVTITEREQYQGCCCLCLFDLEYELINVPPGQYTIRVIELYITENDQVLEFTIELFSPTSGTYCLERSYYPWNQ